MTVIQIVCKQVMVLFVVPHLLEQGGSTARIMDFELLAFLFQYIPKLLHFVLLGWRLQRVTGYIFGSASWGFVLNLAAYFCAAHVAGSVWYLLTVQRVESCIHLQCASMPNCNSSYMGCPVPIAFSKQPLDDINQIAWAENSNITSCLTGSGPFNFGIYGLSVPLVTDVIPVNKILLPLFWGVMTMSSFGNALTPTDHTLEVVFSIVVITCGLLLFTMLIGNIQVFLHSMTSKKEQSQLRIRDLEWWMRRRQLPVQLRQRVCKYERQKWAATRGIDEEATVQDLPEGLRRDIKRHLCLDLVRQVPLFQQMDDLVLNNICERLKPGLFIKDETVLSEGDPVWRMLFIVRGHMQSSYRLQHNNGTSICMLGPGNFCGDELISWCLSTPLKDSLPLSTVTLTTVDMTEVFGLDAQDLKYITEHFSYKFANDKLKRTVRFYSSSWRMWAAVTIQLAWRRHKARRIPNTSGPLNLAEVSLAPNYALRGSTLSQSQRDRLHLYTAMFTSPKPQDRVE
jgi:cyclic nucleotide gated channel